MRPYCTSLSLALLFARTAYFLLIRMPLGDAPNAKQIVCEAAVHVRRSLGKSRARMSDSLRLMGSMYVYTLLVASCCRDVYNLLGCVASLPSCSPSSEVLLPPGDSKLSARDRHGLDKEGGGGGSMVWRGATQVLARKMKA